MATKSRPNKNLVQATALNEREVSAWIATRKSAINKDLAAARKGEPKEWSFARFLAKARKRSG